MKPVHISRLRRIAKHITSAKRAHKTFNFNVFNIDYKTQNNECGTMGCAFGELPALWPKQFAWQGNAVISTRSRLYQTHAELAHKWLGLEPSDFDALFLPYSQHRCMLVTLPDLPTNATAEQVATNINTYCDAVEEISAILKKHSKKNNKRK